MYASTVSFGFGLLHSCNTRYEWLVRPYSAGTCTLQENAKLRLAHERGRSAAPESRSVAEAVRRQPQPDVRLGLDQRDTELFETNPGFAVWLLPLQHAFHLP